MRILLSLLIALLLASPALTQPIDPEIELSRSWWERTRDWAQEHPDSYPLLQQYELRMFKSELDNLVTRKQYNHDLINFGAAIADMASTAACMALNPQCEEANPLFPNTLAIVAGKLAAVVLVSKLNHMKMSDWRECEWEQHHLEVYGKSRTRQCNQVKAASWSSKIVGGINGALTANNMYWAFQKPEED